jgi:hypothetical protein
MRSIIIFSFFAEEVSASHRMMRYNRNQVVEHRNQYCSDHTKMRRTTENRISDYKNVFNFPKLRNLQHPLPERLL